jgi:hypothetical protein
MDKMIVYHGSPRDFDDFEIGHESSSRLGGQGGLHFTTEKYIAKLFAKDRFGEDNNGWIYEVELCDDSSHQWYRFKSIEELDYNDLPDNAIRVFNFEYEKVITEFSIYDTKVSHDFKWLEKVKELLS